MLVCTTWLTVSIVNHEDPTQRTITLVTIGSSLRHLVATVTVVLTWCVPLLVIGLVYPIVTGAHVVTAADLAVGALGQLGAAMVGIAIGLLCSRLVIPRIGLAMLTAAAAILVVLLVRPLSPIRPIMTVLSDERPAGANAVPLTLLAALSAALLAAAVLATKLLAERRE
jgi:hypothetical protein